MEKTFIPITGRSYRANSSHGFRFISHFVRNPSCCFVICKTMKTNYFVRERCDLTFSLLSPVHDPSCAGGQKAAGTICSLLPESSRMTDKHRPKHLIKCGNGQTKTGLFSFTPIAPWDEYSRTTHILVAKTLPIERDWCQIIQNWFSTMKGIINIVIKIQRYIFLLLWFVSKFFFPKEH